MFGEDLQLEPGPNSSISQFEPSLVPLHLRQEPPVVLVAIVADQGGRASSLLFGVCHRVMALFLPELVLRFGVHVRGLQVT